MCARGEEERRRPLASPLPAARGSHAAGSALEGVSRQGKKKNRYPNGYWGLRSAGGTGDSGDPLAAGWLEAASWSCPKGAHIPVVAPPAAPPILTLFFFPLTQIIGLGTPTQPGGPGDLGECLPRAELPAATRRARSRERTLGMGSLRAARTAHPRGQAIAGLVAFLLVGCFL